MADVTAVTIADVYALLLEQGKALGQIKEHLARLNSRTGYLEKREGVHSNKLEDHGGKIADFMARITAVEQVTEVRDGYQDASIREAKLQSWESAVEARDLGHELRGWLHDLMRSVLMALVIVVVLLLALAALLAIAGLI